MHFTFYKIFPEIGECHNRNTPFDIAKSFGLVSGSDLLHKRRQSGVRELVKCAPAHAIADGDLEREVPWPLTAQFVAMRQHRLDIDTVPSPLVKCPSHRILSWIFGADIDVKAVRKIAQRSPK